MSVDIPPFTTYKETFEYQHLNILEMGRFPKMRTWDCTGCVVQSRKSFAESLFHVPLVTVASLLHWWQAEI